MTQELAMLFVEPPPELQIVTDYQGDEIRHFVRFDLRLQLEDDEFAALGSHFNPKTHTCRDVGALKKFLLGLDAVKNEGTDDEKQDREAARKVIEAVLSRTPR